LCANAPAVMTSTLKPKIIAGTWTAVASIAGYKTYCKARDFEDHVPCLPRSLHELSSSTAAREVLGSGELKVGFWSRKVHVDAVAGRARANFKVHGDRGTAWVFMSARRGDKAQVAFETALEDEEDAPAGGFSYYFRRPWEIKRALVDSAKGLVWRKASETTGSDGEKEPEWDLDTLFFLPDGDRTLPSVLLGDAHSVPEFESLCGAGDAISKDEKSRRRLQIFGGIVGACAFLAGSIRLVRSMGVSKSYGYARRTILAHPTVVNALGPSATISTSSGTFQASYLNARLRLIGKDGAVADVDFAATRDGGARGPWRVAMAKMSWAGRTHQLEKSNFPYG